MKFLMPLLTALILAAPASAQERHKQVWVTQADSGDVVRGQILGLSGETLALLTRDNRRVEVPLDRVLRIEIHGDSVKNGAAIGAAIMGGLSLLTCARFGGGGACVGGLVVNAVVGGLVGAGIDALNNGRTTIYSKPAATPAASGPGARVQFKLRF